MTPLTSLLDGTTPDLPEEYAAAGITATPDPGRKVLFDYQFNQGLHAEDLLDMLNTPERRRRYIGEFFGHRLWSPAGAFTDADRELLTEAYADHFMSWEKPAIVNRAVRAFCLDLLTSPSG